MDLDGTLDPHDPVMDPYRKTMGLGETIVVLIIVGLAIAFGAATAGEQFPGSDALRAFADWFMAILRS